MNRRSALAHVIDHLKTGAFLSDLSRRISYPTESQRPDRSELLLQYLEREIVPHLRAMNFDCGVIANPVAGMPPLLLAERIEDAHLPTVLLYGHGDVVNGDESNWSNQRAPWTLEVEGDRWYGRGIADNKGQHSINLAALASVLETRGAFGFNAKVIFEMGEEIGSPGLDAVCARYANRLAADVLIASDGPRLNSISPTIFLGSRGVLRLKLTVRSAFGARHSGNWGGVLANPATILANALASLVDSHGRIQVIGLLPPPISSDIRKLIADLEVGADEGDPPLSQNWGEPGLTPAERIYAWNTLEILALNAGNLQSVIGAIPDAAEAVCELRFVVGTNWRNAGQLIIDHLRHAGFHSVEVKVVGGGEATRTSPNHPWVKWAEHSITETTGKPVTILPNLGGTIPNASFATTLGLPTIWVPHSYPGCRQHAPDEHLLGSLVLEALQIMVGLFWDLGESGIDVAVNK